MHHVGLPHQPTPDACLPWGSLRTSLHSKQPPRPSTLALPLRACSYAFPPLIKIMPAPLLDAARATVDSGRAARQWIEKKRDDS